MAQAPASPCSVRTSSRPLRRHSSSGTYVNRYPRVSPVANSNSTRVSSARSCFGNAPKVCSRREDTTSLRVLATSSAFAISGGDARGMSSS